MLFTIESICVAFRIGLMVQHCAYRPSLSASSGHLECCTSERVFIAGVEFGIGKTDIDK